MGTKNEPGNYDCYANAKDDEPMFVLLARDALAPGLVTEWAKRYNTRSANPNAEKVAEALACADSMHNWYLLHDCKSCGHAGSRHGPTRGCEAGTIHGQCDCYGFHPNLDRPIIPPQLGDWLILLICCGRHDGYQVCQTETEAREFAESYIDGGGHVRTTVLWPLSNPIRIGFHDATSALIPDEVPKLVVVGSTLLQSAGNH